MPLSLVLRSTHYPGNASDLLDLGGWLPQRYKRLRRSQPTSNQSAYPRKQQDATVLPMRLPGAVCLKLAIQDSQILGEASNGLRATLCQT